MTDFYLDPTTHDLVVINGEIRLTTDEEFIVQRIKTSLLMNLGEWFLDTTLGVDYFDKIYVKGGDVESRAEREIRRVVLDIDGVASIKALDVSLDSATRRLSVNLEVVGDTGELISIEVNV